MTTTTHDSLCATAPSQGAGTLCVAPSGPSIQGRTMGLQGNPCWQVGCLCWLWGVGSPRVTGILSISGRCATSRTRTRVDTHARASQPPPFARTLPGLVCCIEATHALRCVGDCCHMWAHQVAFVHDCWVLFNPDTHTRVQPAHANRGSRTRCVWWCRAGETEYEKFRRLAAGCARCAVELNTAARIVTALTWPARRPLHGGG